MIPVADRPMPLHLARTSPNLRRIGAVIVVALVAAGASGPSPTRLAESQVETPATLATVQPKPNQGTVATKKKTATPVATKSKSAVTPPSTERPKPPTPAPSAVADPAPPDVRSVIEQTRLTLEKWIETQQIISKERNDWQQGKEIVQSRIELVGKEVSVLQAKIAQAEGAVVETNKTRDELIAENDLLKASTTQLASAATVMEDEVRKLVQLTPDPTKARLDPLLQRIPADPSNTRVSMAERFQNVLGILNELNKDNSLISVSYEIRTLADGSSSEVQVIYIGLAQAYYLSPRGDAGIGRPSPDGWRWEPAPATAPEILTALEILQGKQTPSFVPLPMKIQ